MIALLEEYKHLVLPLLTAALALFIYLVVFADGKSGSSSSRSVGPKEWVDPSLDIDNVDGWAEGDEDDDGSVAAEDDSVPAPPVIPAEPVVELEPVEDPDAPFQVGDRVVLRNLKGAKHLNGRHGAVATPRDPSHQMRYGIDLDLINTPSPMSGNKFTASVSVKADNLEEEPPIVDDGKRADVNDGVLEEKHARSMMHIFQTIYQAVTTSFPAERGRDERRILSCIWNNWDGTYPAVQKFLTQDIYQQVPREELDKKLNPNNPKEGYQTCLDAIDDLRAVKAWGSVKMETDFWVSGSNESGTLVIPDTNKRAVYVVVGLKGSLWKIVKSQQQPRPIKLKLTIVPYFGRLVSVGPTLVPGEHVEMASVDVARRLQNSVLRASKEGRIISRFNQLEISEPSLVGVPPAPLVSPVQPGGEASVPPEPEPEPEPEPASEKELGLLDNLTEFEPYEGPKDMNMLRGPVPPEMRQGMWNFLRNPQQKPKDGSDDGDKCEYLMRDATGRPLGEFTCSANEGPTAVHILVAMTKACVKTGKRPSMVGIDNQKCVSRLQFLLKGLSTAVALINVGPQGGGAQSLPPQPKPTDHEHALVERFRRFAPFPMLMPNDADPGARSGMWNVLRKKDVNAKKPVKGAVIVDSNGRSLGFFKVSDLDKPKADEVLEGILRVCDVIGKRPCIIGVDERDCCFRLRFLLRELASSTRVLGIQAQPSAPVR